MKKLVLLLLIASCAAQTKYVVQSVDGNNITLTNISAKTITKMGGDLLDAGRVVGVYEHDFYTTGMTPGMSEPMMIDELTAPSINLTYINFKDGSSWRATVKAQAASATSGQTLTLDLANSYCKQNTFTPGSTLHGTWRNSVTGCSAFGSVEKLTPYICAKDPNYGYPDLAQRTCKPGICCTIQYTALRPTISADSDCLSTGNGFYTGVQGEQQ